MICDELFGESFQEEQQLEGSVFDGVDEAELNEAMKNTNELFEYFLLDEIYSMTEDTKENFLNSPELKFLITEGAIARRTIVKFSKKDEFNRREKIAAFDIARKKNDKLYKDVIKFRAKSRRAFAQIMKKYGPMAGIVAKRTQKEYLKRNPITNKIIPKTTDVTDKKDSLLGHSTKSSTRELPLTNKR